AAVVDEAADRPPQAVPRVRAGVDRVPVPGQPQGARVPPAIRGGDDPRRRQPVALLAVRRARPVPVPELHPGGAVRAHGVPADRRPAVLRDARAAPVLLVLARTAARRGAGRLAGPAAEVRTAGRALGARADDAPTPHGAGGIPAGVPSAAAVVRQQDPQDLL